MENKNVGWLLLGVCVIIVIVIILFNRTTMEAVKNSCYLQHGYTANCEMFDSINSQTYLALAISGVIFIIAIVLIFTKPKEKIIVKKVKEPLQLTEVDLSSFNSEEKKVFNMIREQGAMFQADLVDKSGLHKSRITRIIDRLEGKGLVERKRRGLTNIVVPNNRIKIK